MCVLTRMGDQDITGIEEVSVPTNDWVVLCGQNGLKVMKKPGSPFRSGRLEFEASR